MGDSFHGLELSQAFGELMGALGPDTCQEDSAPLPGATSRAEGPPTQPEAPGLVGSSDCPDLVVREGNTPRQPSGPIYLHRQDREAPNAGEAAAAVTARPLEAILSDFLCSTVPADRLQPGSSGSGTATSVRGAWWALDCSVAAQQRPLRGCVTRGVPQEAAWNEVPPHWLG